MAQFEMKSVAAALEDGLAGADHLTAKHAGTVAAARALAAKIDAWDTIVQWAVEDAAETRGRPAVPANDNTSLPTFLKYMESLGLSVDKATAGRTAKAPVEPVQESVPESPGADRESKARSTLGLIAGGKAG